MRKIIDIIRILLGLNETEKERNYCKYSKGFRNWKSDLQRGNDMKDRIQEIHCSKCKKYLFTEKDTEYGYERENDNKSYSYDPSEDEFICYDCL